MKNKYSLAGLLVLILASTATPQSNFTFPDQLIHENYPKDLNPGMEGLYPAMHLYFNQEYEHAGLYHEMDSLTLKRYQDFQQHSERANLNPEMETKSTGSTNHVRVKLDSIVRYDFISDTDSVIASKTFYQFDSNGNWTVWTTYNWDSKNKVWVIFSKYDFEYDNNGNRTLYAYYTKDTGNQAWAGNWKYEYEYDNNGNRTLYAYYTWDTSNQAWVGRWKYENKYDANGNWNTYASYTWNPDYQAWVGNWKNAYEHDSDGKLIIGAYYNWDNIWVIQSKSEYEYDANGYMILVRGYRWDIWDEVWVRNSKSEYEYDANGYMILFRGYRWDIWDEVWVRNSKWEYENDANGNMILSTYYWWKVWDEVWVRNSKWEYEYDANGNMTLYSYYIWNSENQAWIGNWKFRYEYDANGNRTLNSRYTWDSENQAWLGNWKFRYEYDSNGNMTLDIDYQWDSVNHVWLNFSKWKYELDTNGNRIIWTRYIGESGNETWVIAARGFYHWSRFHNIYLENQNATVGRIIEIPIKTSELASDDNITAYQLELSYDNSTLEYVDYSLADILTEGGNILVNSADDKVTIEWSSDNPIVGEGEILKLRFKVIDSGEIKPAITNALFNASTILIENGTITSIYKYGDIDANDYIQAYDAALALQYSLGLDPIPSVDPLPWQPWRIETANVDGIEGITANDAEEILKYSIRLIDIFPVEDTTNSVKSTLADVTITYEDEELVFSSSGELFGLNVFVRDNHDILGEPEFLNSEMLKAINIDEENYAIGLAAAHSPEEDEIFMKIPVSETGSMSITLEMFVNTEPKTVSVSITPTSIEVISEQILIYPNPANNDLFVSGIEINSTISIYDLSGNQRLSLASTSAPQRIDVSALETGIYVIKVEKHSFQRAKRFMKH